MTNTRLYCIHRHRPGGDPIGQHATTARYYTTREAARMVGVGHQTLARMFLACEIPEPPRLGSQRVLTAADVEDIRRALVPGNDTSR